MPGEITRQRIDEICARHRTYFHLVVRRNRDRWNVAARKEIARYLSREKGWSLSRIGNFLGDRDHSTVHHLIHFTSARMRRGSEARAPGASLPSL